MVWSLGLLFTANITRTLSRTVEGEVTLFMMMRRSKLVSFRTFDVSPFMVVFESLLVMFVRFELDKFVMLRLKAVPIC